MKQASVDTRRLVGGSLCLDFANSVDWASDGSERPAHADVLGEPQDLVSWGRRLELVPDDVPLVVSGRELAAAHELRRAIHSVFAAIAAGDVPSRASLERLDRHHAQATAEAHIIPRDGAWTLDWPPDERRVRFAVALSAIDLLRDEARLERVRSCPGNNCGWLFLDFTGRRRWCAMEVCGSRAKMRRFYERQRSGRRDGR
jgi:predicted RNA-binding Zn ribbon-like protein